LKLIFDI